MFRPGLPALSSSVVAASVRACCDIGSRPSGGKHIARQRADVLSVARTLGSIYLVPNPSQESG